MRKALACLLVGTLSAPVAVFAQSIVWPTSGDLDIYYSHANQKVDQATHNPAGSGVGFSGQINLPFGLFVDGMYQYNGEDQAQFGVADGLGLQDQARVGGGLQWFVPRTPLTLYGKADYVHYRYESATFINYDGSTFSAHDNDDGAGYFLGFRTRLPGFELYGQGGYLHLADTRGQEYTAGVAVPLGRIIRRRALVQLFAEYDWTSLHERAGGYHDIFYDYRAGIRIPFY